VPAAKPARFALAVIVPAFIPLAGVSVSQVALPLAAQVSVPLPVLDIPIVCAAGLVPPAVPEKVRLLRLS